MRLFALGTGHAVFVVGDPSLADRAEYSVAARWQLPGVEFGCMNEAGQ